MLPKVALRQAGFVKRYVKRPHEQFQSYRCVLSSFVPTSYVTQPGYGDLKVCHSALYAVTAVFILSFEVLLSHMPLLFSQYHLRNRASRLSRASILRFIRAS